LARWFVPEGRVRLAVRDLVMHLAAGPPAGWLVKRLLAPESMLGA
jgi:hypothetical protein